MASGSPILCPIQRDAPRDCCRGWSFALPSRASSGGNVLASVKTIQKRIGHGRAQPNEDAGLCGEWRSAEVERGLHSSGFSEGVLCDGSSRPTGDIRPADVIQDLLNRPAIETFLPAVRNACRGGEPMRTLTLLILSLIHISEPTRRTPIS